MLHGRLWHVGTFLGVCLGSTKDLWANSPVVYRNHIIYIPYFILINLYNINFREFPKTEPQRYKQVLVAGLSLVSSVSDVYLSGAVSSKFKFSINCFA